MARRGLLSRRANKRSFARKASNVNAKNVYNPRKLHKGGEIIR